MFVVCGIWCLADVSSVSPSSEQKIADTIYTHILRLSCVLANSVALFTCIVPQTKCWKTAGELMLPW